MRSDWKLTTQNSTWYLPSLIFVPHRPPKWMGTCPFTTIDVFMEIGANVMTDKSIAAKNLLKLIDASTQCRQMFHAAADTLTDPVYKEVIENVQQRLDQFGIELRNEIRRLGEADFDQLRFEPLQENSCDRALRRMLD